MAVTAPVLIQKPFEPKLITAIHPNDSSIINPLDSSVTAADLEIPTIDYFMLFSDDPDQRSKALDYLGQVCEEFGFFYLVNHGMPDSVFEGLFKGISDFFELTEFDERKEYRKKNSMDRIRWGLRATAGENREYLKVVAHPQYHSPPANPAGFSEALEEYLKRSREVVFGLGRAVSKSLGFEESYIEKAFKLESGFDVSAMNLYPPNFQSKSPVGLPDHTDPGFFISLVQDVNGGLQVLTHDGKWVNVYLPHNAILIQIGDHLEILTNGKYKSHIHRVIVDNNKVKRISVATLHGPSLDTFVAPAEEFVDDSHPPAYRGMTYKESLEATGDDEIDVQSFLDHLRL